MAGSFSIKSSDINRIVSKADYILGLEQKIMRQKVEAITNIVYRTARAKRPMITKAMMKQQGRTKRVSDPGAQAGVPVDTGSLQIAIKKSVTDNGKSVTGRVYVDQSASNTKTGVPVIQYAKVMEFGSSRVQRRPFLRPAITLNKEWAKRIWHTKGSGSPGDLTSS